MYLYLMEYVNQQTKLKGAHVLMENDMFKEGGNGSMENDMFKDRSSKKHTDHDYIIFHTNHVCIYVYIR